MGSILSWIIIGLLAGLFVNYIFKKQKKYFIGTILAAIVGSFVSGLVYSALKFGELLNFIDQTSLIVALFGSIFILYIINSLIYGEDKEIEKFSNF